MYFSGCPFCHSFIISKNMARAAIDRKYTTPAEFFGPQFTEEQKKEFAKYKAKAAEIREQRKYDY